MVAQTQLYQSGDSHEAGGLDHDCSHRSNYWHMTRLTYIKMLPP